MTKDMVIAILLAVTVKARRFNALLPALGESNPANFSHYNRVGYSASSLKTLEYDVKKAWNVSAKDLRDAKSAFAKAHAKEETITQTDDTGTGTDDSGQKVAKNGTEVSKNETQAEVFELASEEVKKEIKLRERYPFLNAPDTPHIEKFYALVGINGTAYHQVLEARKELFVKVVPSEEAGGDPESVTMTNEEIFELAKKAVENFELNIEGVEELDHYQAEKEILGNHDIFREVAMKRKVDAMKIANLAKRNGLIKGYINKNIAKMEGMEDTTATVKKIRDWELELKFVQERLEVPQEDRYVSKLDNNAGGDEEE